ATAASPTTRQSPEDRAPAGSSATSRPFTDDTRAPAARIRTYESASAGLARKDAKDGAGRSASHATAAAMAPTLAQRNARWFHSRGRDRSATGARALTSSPLTS